MKTLLQAFVSLITIYTCKMKKIAIAQKWFFLLALTIFFPSV